MSSYNTPEQLRSDLKTMESQYEAQLPRYNSSLRRWLIFWSLGFVFYYFLWEYAGIRWTLLLSIPLGIVGTGIALAGVLVVPRRLRKVRDQLQELEEVRT